MKTNTGLKLMAGALLASALNLSAAELGDPAAPLEIKDWVKGSPVSLDATKGKKVVVVEFWATWCGPCKASIPHLSDMQSKYKDKNIVFVGVSDETTAKVQPFVDEMGDKMNYTVAVDKNGKTSAGYMEAYGINGIPHAFVVDKEGRIAWHGHPMAGLDKVLERLASNSYDLSSEKKRDGAQQKLQEYFAIASKDPKDERLEALGQQLMTIDKEIGGIEPGEKLDLADVRKQAQFQVLMRKYQEGLNSGKSEPDLMAIEKEAAPLAPKDFDFAEFKGRFQYMQVFKDYYRAVTVAGNGDKADELEKKLSGLTSKNQEMLNDMAWTLLTDENIKIRNVKLALKISKMAVDASGGKSPDVLDTYARALYDNGKAEEAVAMEKKAIELTEDAEKKKELGESLARYQGKGK